MTDFVLSFRRQQKDDLRRGWLPAPIRQAPLEKYFRVASSRTPQEINEETRASDSIHEDSDLKNRASILLGRLPLTAHFRHLEVPDVIVGVVPREERAAVRAAVHPIAAPNRQLLREVEALAAGFRIVLRDEDRFVPERHDLKRPAVEHRSVAIRAALRDFRFDNARPAVGAAFPASFPTAAQIIVSADHGRSGQRNRQDRHSRL
jgi:hypothetical protein